MDENFSNYDKRETPVKSILILKSFGNTNNRFVFSFDKENFGNFEVNLSDDMLNHDFLTKPRFGLYTPLGSSLDFFKMLYQHSLKKYDEEYRIILEKLYSISYEDNIEQGHDLKTFEEVCLKQDKKFNKFLSKNDATSYLFSVDEDDGRIIYREKAIVKIVSCEVDLCYLETPERDIRDAMIEFLIKFNEMYLQGFLGTKYLRTLMDLNDKYAKRLSNIAYDEDKQAYTELFESFSKVDHLLQQNYEDLANMSVEDRKKFYDEEIMAIFNKNCNGCLFVILPDPKVATFGWKKKHKNKEKMREKKNKKKIKEK